MLPFLFSRPLPASEVPALLERLGQDASVEAADG
jgi:hypothetical protein